MDRKWTPYDETNRRPMTRAPATPELTFPQTLAGTWPSATAGCTRYDQLHHITALDAVAAALTAPPEQLARPVTSSASEPGTNIFARRADSQGRMDLIAMLTGKVKEFVNATIAGLRPLADSMPRSRP